MLTANQNFIIQGIGDSDENIKTSHQVISKVIRNGDTNVQVESPKV